MQRALFIFRRDLRLEDNTGLIFALEQFSEVVVAFIFTPEQTQNNSYRSDHCLQFMIESLEELEKEIEKKGGKLQLFFGKPEEVVKKCIKTLSLDAVVVNRDYTPYSVERDKKIASLCKKEKIVFYSFDDLLLHPVEETLKKNGSPYTIFTPFYKNAIKMDVSKPVSNPYKNYYSKAVSFAEKSSIYKKILPKRENIEEGGRKAGLKLLRAKMSKEGNSRLSAHLKFTTISCREAYHALQKRFGKASPIVRSLYWRDFFSSISFYFPEVFKGSFHKKFDKITWSRSKKNFTLWCEGKTGVPIVDAAMRELNETGFIHNRLRMIVASFLIKDLHINWRWGEKYFAQKLIDYDPAVNNGNWQWVASTGCDAQPYFRVFNPWTQGSKFDPNATHIKQWVIELKDIPSKVIHSWYLESSYLQNPSYPAPMIDHAKEAQVAQKEYSRFR